MKKISSTRWKIAKCFQAIVLMVTCVITMLPQEVFLVKAATEMTEATIEETKEFIPIPDTITGSNAIWVKGSSYDDNTLDVIKWHYNSSSAKHYLYLPASADLNNLVIWHTFSNSLYIDGTKVESGATTDIFKEAESGSATYTAKSGNSTYTLKVYKSNSINTVFFTTENGSLDYVNEKKGNKDKGTFLCVDTDGNIVEEELKEIKGRGNSSWEAAQKLFQKYPYNIKLDGKVKLFGMKKSKKWCFLANDFDQSLLRNKFVYDLADVAGMDYSPEGELADVYQNGRYIGNYLVTSKIEIDSNRIDIYDLEGETEDLNGDLEKFSRGGDTTSVTAGKNKYVNIPTDPEDITGGYLLEFELDERYCSEISGFVTKKRQPVVIKQPECASYQQVNYINNYFQEMENAVYSSDGYYNGKHFTEYLDMESAAQMFIMEELTLDNDAVATSFYMYKDTNDVFKFGPVWDFDWALGRYDKASCTDTTTLNLKNKKIYNSQTSQSMDVTLLGALWKHDAFKKEVARVWMEKFYPYLKDATTTISDLATTNEASANMNFSRHHFLGTTYWGSAYTGSTYAENINYVKNFVKNRVSFLHDYYAEYYQGIVPTQEPTSTPEPTSEPGTVIYFDNSVSKWSNVYAYVWNNTTDATVFEATMIEANIYKFNITGKYGKVLFKNTPGVNWWNLQTIDLVIPTSGATCYKPAGTWNKPSGSWYNYEEKVTTTPVVTNEPTETPVVTEAPKLNKTTVYYKASSSWTSAYIHYKVDGEWTKVPGVKMTKTTEVEGYNYKFTIDLGDTTTTTVCFNNGNGAWDSRNQANYTLGVGNYGIKNQSIEKLQLEYGVSLSTDKASGSVDGITNISATVLCGTAPYSYEYEIQKDGVVVENYVTTSESNTNIFAWNTDSEGAFDITVTVTDANGNVVLDKISDYAVKNTNKITVYYKNSSWSQANIHYQVNGTWTSVPGVKMSESDNSDYTWMYVIDLGDTTSAYVCFNNGKGSWDSKNSSNYYISGSAVGIKNGNIYTIQ